MCLVSVFVVLALVVKKALAKSAKKASKTSKTSKAEKSAKPSSDDKKARILANKNIRRWKKQAEHAEAAKKGVLLEKIRSTRLLFPEKPRGGQRGPRYTEEQLQVDLFICMCFVALKKTCAGEPLRRDIREMQEVQEL